MRGHPGKGCEQILQPHGLGGVERQEWGEQQRSRHKGGLPPGGGMGHSIANSFLLFPRIIPQNREGRKEGEKSTRYQIVVDRNCVSQYPEQEDASIL